MSRYIATLRAIFESDDDVTATLIADEIAQNAKSELTEDNDLVEVTQVIPLSQAAQVIHPAEMVDHLRRSRDLLIQTRISQCFDLAKELDKVAWVLEHRDEERFDLAGYDHAAIFDLANELLGRKE